MEFTTKSKILVLFANAYSLKDETGKSVEGCTVHYLFWGEGGEQLYSISEPNVSKSVGVQRAKVSLPIGFREKIMIAPAIYEGSFQMSIGSDGKPVLKLVDVAYISNVEMKEHVVPGIVVPGMKDPQKK